METISFRIEYIIWQNEANSYTICEVSNQELGDFVAVGYLPFVNVGDKLSATGSWEIHIEHGEQFKIESYKKAKMELEEDIFLFLSSGAIKGIGESTAKKIMDAFGKDSLSVIRENPLKLAKIKGISEKKAIEIHDDYIRQQGISDIVIFFNKYDISASYAYKVYKEYGDEAIEKIKENPYILCRDIEGVGFKTADKIASKIGMYHNCRQRISAGVEYVLSVGVSNGHTFMPKDILILQVMEFLGVDECQVQDALVEMTVSGDVRLNKEGENINIYLPAYYIAENGVAAYLSHMSEEKFKVKQNELFEDIAQVEKEMKMDFAPMQKEAIEKAVRNSLLIITGGPGTGKTTIIRAIIALMKRKKLKVALGAPTGRAAKRMTQLCNMDAKTIHRLLEMDASSMEGKWVFQRNDTNPLSADVIIIDEMSMVDILLMYHLLKAVKKGARLIMVGDADQLPSVGAGQVLKDMLQSNVIKSVRLNEIFRQAEQSMIVVNAHKINKGQMPEIIGRHSDFFMLTRPNVKQGVEEILQLCTKRLPEYLRGSDPLTEIQILSPVKRGEAGVEELNKLLQSKINPPSKEKREITRFFYTIREGDKIMQTRNNYEIDWERNDGSKGGGIYNGDIGFVEKLHMQEGYADIIFDGEKLVKYPFDLLKDIELAYAMTVHKSQGSEFDAVILPLYPMHSMLQSKHLLYTAVTRAKKLVVLVGRQDILYNMVNNQREDERRSGLSSRIEKAFRI
ncbi:MAG: ATP-dependent RecD-like DNA helicase [Clostridia bacterium]|nr:ATP-dependent RecD-like DNA helicase [Clostridia bacterium]